jgi:hypothetical protein
MGDYLEKGVTFQSGASVTHTDLNNLVDNATIKAGAIGNGNLKVSSLADSILGFAEQATANESTDDYLLVWSNTDSTLKKIKKGRIATAFTSDSGAYTGGVEGGGTTVEGQTTIDATDGSLTMLGGSAHHPYFNWQFSAGSDRFFGLVNEVLLIGQDMQIRWARDDGSGTKNGANLPVFLARAYGSGGTGMTFSCDTPQNAVQWSFDGGFYITADEYGGTTNKQVNLCLQALGATGAVEQWFLSCPPATGANTWLVINTGVQAGTTTTKTVVIGSSTNVVNFSVYGAVAGTSKPFRIPHPVLKNKDLVHMAVEGPRPDLIYRGQVALSKKGTAQVNIDTAVGMSAGTFVALTRDPQVFLQNNQSFNRVKGSVTDGVITIECEDSTSKETIDWMVVAERQDASIKDSNLTDKDGNLILEPDPMEVPEGAK